MMDPTGRGEISAAQVVTGVRNLGLLDWDWDDAKHGDAVSQDEWLAIAKAALKEDWVL